MAGAFFLTIIPIIRLLKTWMRISLITIEESNNWESIKTKKKGIRKISKI